LGLRELPGRPLVDTLIEHLRSRHTLVVLDNCEHLLGACADLGGCAAACLCVVNDSDYEVPPVARTPPVWGQ
jgi:hypothetical protein